MIDSEKLKIAIDKMEIIRSCLLTTELPRKYLADSLGITLDKIEKGGDMPDPKEFSGEVYDKDDVDWDLIEKTEANEQLPISRRDTARALLRLKTRLDKYQKQRDKLQDFVFNEIIPLPEFRALKDRVDEAYAMMDEHARHCHGPWNKYRLDWMARKLGLDYASLAEKQAKEEGYKPELPEMLESEELDDMMSPGGSRMALRHALRADKPEPPENDYTFFLTAIPNKCRCSVVDVPSEETKHRYIMKRNSACPEHGKPDDPQPGELCWFSGATTLDGEGVDFRYAATYDKYDDIEPDRLVQQDEIRELRMVKGALKLLGHGDDEFVNYICKIALKGIGNKVTIEWRTE